VRAEERRFDGGDYGVTVGGNFGVVGEDEIDAAEFPVIGGVGRIVEFDRAGGEVAEFDEFFVAEFGLVTDFVDDDRAGARAGVDVA
jgi:hypothetical protein